MFITNTNIRMVTKQRNLNLKRDVKRMRGMERKNLHVVKEIGILSIPKTSVLVGDIERIDSNGFPHVGNFTSGSVKSSLSSYSSQ